MVPAVLMKTKVQVGGAAGNEGVLALYIIIKQQVTIKFY